ncbi:hypothetical protein D0809_08620 [Flavobacterium circumlabens]|uniref:Lipoprotein n=1 Tax=Flavobacterium circumlabens TaxID=2133765 RepID=A0A4Y7UH86_9FLAO|nr:hypothetical protein [Flavobacterium circumlabens]TCN59979.1 hypothetical protein EV142_102599 [Flavobacterium circumlabens]TEB45219.1 hypothetical protein D0809_08620 [Flavobacterium circumlabens]
MKKIIILLISGLLLVSCEQVSKSIDETFHTKDTLVHKEAEKPNPEPLKNTQPDVQQIINTVLEKHTTVLRQHHLQGREIDFLTDTNALKNAEAALRKLPQYAGKEIFIYSTLYFYNDGTINVMLQHPENPKYVDAYEFRDNKWSEPKPVQLSVHDDVKGRLVSLNKTSFVNAAKLTDIYNKKAQEIEGAQPLSSTYLTIWNNQIRWYPITINGSREKYSIQFNDDGSLKSFEQD